MVPWPVTEEATPDEARETGGVFRGSRPRAEFTHCGWFRTGRTWLGWAHRLSFPMYEEEDDDHDVLDPRP